MYQMLGKSFQLKVPRKYLKRPSHVSPSVLTTVGCGRSCRVAPVTPNAWLPGAIDAHWSASYLDKINCARMEAC